MSNPLDRPGRSDRRAAVRRIKDAVTAGVIVEADGDLRIQQVESAGTNADVQAQLTDLTARAAQAYVAPVPPNPSGPVSPRIDGGATGRRVASAVARVPRRRIAPIVVGLLIAAGAVNGVVHSVVGGFTPGASSSGPAQSADVDMFTAATYAELVSDVRTATGGTQVNRVVMYPSYASVQVPTDAGETLYSWRGSLDELTTTTASPDTTTVDLAAYRPEVLFGLVDRAKGLLDAPSTWYVVVQPALAGDGATIYAYANETGGKGVYVSATQDGTLVRTQRF